MINIRPYQIIDHDFICSSYLNSTYYNSLDRTVRLVKKIDHDKAMDKKINALVAESVVLVATPENDSDLIVGYILFGFDILHYCYVKKDFRQMGVASRLLKETDLNSSFEVTSTHLSKFSHLILSKLTKSYTYNPFKIPIL